MPLGGLGRMSSCLGPVIIIIPPWFVMHGRRVFDVNFLNASEHKKGTPMKKLLTVIAAAVFVIYPCVTSALYIIHLKDGREFATDRYYEEGDQIKLNDMAGSSGLKKILTQRWNWWHRCPT